MMLMDLLLEVRYRRMEEGEVRESGMARLPLSGIRPPRSLTAKTQGVRGPITIC